MKHTFVLMLTALMVAPCLRAKNNGVDGTTDKLRVSDRPVRAISVEQFAVYNAAAEISEKAKIPIGVAAIQPKQEPTIKLDFRGGTVADLLNLLVSEAPGYQWQETDKGVIHLSRVGARVSLLDVSMSYPGAVHKTRKEIWEDIGQRPEISAWLQAHACTRSEFFTGHEFSEHNTPISIEPGDLTLEQLLDQVAVASGANYWAVLQSPSGSSCKLGIILW